MSVSVNICRFCIRPCSTFKNIEKAYHKTLDMLLPTLDLTLSKDPVVCTNCSQIMQKYLTFKTLSMDIKNFQDVLGMCLFCKKSPGYDPFIFLNSQNMDVLLLKAMMELYFPELNLQINVEALICCACSNNIQQIFDFLVNWLSVEQHIQKYCQTVGVFSKGEVNLNDVLYYVQKTEFEREKSNNSRIGIITLGADEFIKAEPSEDVSKCLVKVENGEAVIPIDYESTEILNENIKSMDHKVKLEHELTGIGEVNTNINGQCVKIEQVWLEEENIDLKQTGYDPLDNSQEKIENVMGESMKCENDSPSSDEEKYFLSTGDHILDSIERVVRMWADYKYTNYDNTEQREAPEENKKTDRYIVEKETKEEIRMNKTVKRRWWANSPAINADDSHQLYFSKTELRAMISRVSISGEKKYQCQLCQFIARAKCSMNRHMMLHQHPSELPFFQCHHCGFKTTRKSDLANHLISHRDPSRKPMYRCHHCPFFARRKYILKVHLAKHQFDMNVVTYECHTCGYKTYDKKTLKLHIIRHQAVKRKSRAKVYKCERCPYTTERKAAFDNHAISHLLPTETEMYRCECCGYESKYKSSMPTHMERHRKPVQCKHCLFKTKYTATLRRHLRRVHGILAGRRKSDIVGAKTELVPVVNVYK